MKSYSAGRAITGPMVGLCGIRWEWRLGNGKEEGGEGCGQKKGINFMDAACEGVRGSALDARSQPTTHQCRTTAESFAFTHQALHIDESSTIFIVHINNTLTR